MRFVFGSRIKNFKSIQFSLLNTHDVHLMSAEIWNYKEIKFRLISLGAIVKMTLKKEKKREKEWERKFAFYFFLYTTVLIFKNMQCYEIRKKYSRLCVFVFKHKMIYLFNFKGGCFEFDLYVILVNS